MATVSHSSFAFSNSPAATALQNASTVSAGPVTSAFFSFPPPHPATNISITHTDKYVAVIIHDEDEVGIDVESLDRDFSVVEKKALSEDEIDDLEKDKRNEQLAIYWCAKEAIYKRMSQNRVVYAEQIEVEKFNVRKEGELEATFIHKDEHEEEFELEYMIFDRHVLVWLVG